VLAPLLLAERLVAHWAQRRPAGIEQLVAALPAVRAPGLGHLPEWCDPRRTNPKGHGCRSMENVCFEPSVGLILRGGAFISAPRSLVQTRHPRPHGHYYGRLFVVVVRVLGWRLAVARQHLGIARTRIGRELLAQVEQDAPLVAEVEHVCDRPAYFEIEVAKAYGGRTCFAHFQLVGSRELSFGSVPMDTAEPKRVQMVIGPIEGATQTLMHVLERLIATNANRAADVGVVEEARIEDVDGLVHHSQLGSLSGQSAASSQPLHRLAGDLLNGVEVTVAVEESGAVHLRDRGDQ
jgi:hypothetical protein